MRGRGPRRRGARAGVEPVELLVAGENVEPALLAEVSTLGHPPRVLGVYRRDDLPAGVRDVTLALWHVGDPGNVGTLLRAADAFGAGVALSAGCADPTGPKALRASAGAVFRVPLAPFDDAPSPRVALVARDGAAARRRSSSPRRVTFVLGAEREGLPDDVLARASCARRSRSRGEAESLNVAMAGAIALYELARRARSRRLRS